MSAATTAAADFCEELSKTGEPAALVFTASVVAVTLQTMTVCHDDLRHKAPAHPHDECTETRVEMTDTQL